MVLHGTPGYSSRVLHDNYSGILRDTSGVRTVRTGEAGIRPMIVVGTSGSAAKAVGRPTPALPVDQEV